MRWHPTALFAVVVASCLALSPLELAAQARSSSSLAPPPSPLRPVSPGQIRVLNDQAAIQFGKGQVPVPPDGQEIDLPESPAQVIFTNCGWRLAMTFPGIAKIGIFNLATLKFDGFIPAAEPGVMLASGGSLLAVYVPSSRFLEIYDLNTLEKRAGREINLGGAVAGMAMGLYQPLQIFAVVDVGKTEKFTAALIRLPGMEILKPEIYQEQDQQGHRSFRSLKPLLDVNADETGSFFFASYKDDFSASLACLSLQPDNRVLLTYPFTTIGMSRPDRSGKFSISRNGLHRVDHLDHGDAQHIPIKDSGGLKTPVVGHDSFVTRFKSNEEGKTKVGFRVYAYDKIKLLAELPVSDENAFHMLPSRKYPNEPGGNGDLLAAATSYRIVHIGSEWPKLKIFPLGSQR